MNTYKIAVLPGDGTGPEVAAEGVKVLKALQEKAGFKMEFTTYDFGGDRYLAKGEVLPDSAIEELRGYHAIFLGAIGHPDVKPGILEKGILLRLRFELDQYINLRPVKLYPGVWTPIKDKGPDEIDFVVVRENCAGLYTGGGGIIKKDSPNEVAIQEMVYTRFDVDRCLRYAFEYTKRRDREKTLTLCGKTNVLTYVYDLWERAFHAMGQKDYPDIKREYAHVDAITMWMVKNPEWFDVIVTGNMFGDIITDLGAITQGGLFSFMAAIMMTYTPLKRLTKVANLIQRSVGAAERVFEIIDEVPEITERPDAVSLKRAKGNITFERVTFAYEKLPVLQDFSFSVAAGEMVALVGPSGVGKSTIISLLNRFYEPQAGAIKIDGLDIRCLTMKSLADNIALVDQDTFLFHDTIKNNIRYGRPGADDDAVFSAARQAYADEFIRLLPQQYETSIGDRGVRLSGGQRQRICIARAILKDAPILVLDEATSALDTESEAIVQKALANLMKNRTSFVIAHRLSTVHHADKIIVLEDGQVVEMGVHDELLKKRGLYNRLYEMQFKTEQ